MKFDDILRHLGEFGRYQKQQYFMLSMVVFSCAVQIMLTVFTLATPEHRCAIPNYSNDTYDTQNPHHEQLINKYIPLDSDPDHAPVYSRCTLYTDIGLPSTGLVRNVTGVSVQQSQRNSSTDNDIMKKCSHWVFESSSSTIVTQMSFVCGREILKSHATMTMMSGQMIGCLLLGPIADVTGRKKMMMLSLTLHLASSILTTWASNIYLLGTVYLINGMAMASAYCTSFTLGMEMIGPKWRHATGVAVTGFWSIGMLWLCLLAYFIRDWQHLQLAASCPIIFFAVYFWLVPESARWLIRKGRYSEAEAIIARAADVNKKPLPSTIISRENSEVSKVPSESLLTLLKSPTLVFRALIVFFNWFVCSLTYYGLSLNIGQLSGNVYLNFSLSALFELAAYAIIIFAMSRFGRKILYCTSILLGGLACFLTLFPVLYADDSAKWTVRMLAMIGKFGVSGAFAVIWLYTSEMFPTSLRASITGTSSGFARIGAVLASYIANLSVGGDVGVVMPQIIFGASGIVAGLLAILLPETHKRQLPETVIDAVQIQRNVNDRAAVTESLALAIDEQSPKSKSQPAEMKHLISV